VQHILFLPSLFPKVLTLTYTLLSGIIVSGMIISIVSALGFFVCFFLGCKNSSKSRLWKFGKVHMTAILKIHLIRFYELVIHCKRKRELWETSPLASEFKSPPKTNDRSQGKGNAESGTFPK
jgi:hypothetical protein